MKAVCTHIGSQLKVVIEEVNNTLKMLFFPPTHLTCFFLRVILLFEKRKKNTTDLKSHVYVPIKHHERNA